MLVIEGSLVGGREFLSCGRVLELSFLEVSGRIEWMVVYLCVFYGRVERVVRIVCSSNIWRGVEYLSFLRYYCFC